MLDTGIVRNVDDLGRIVIPKELRRVLDITSIDQMDIYTDNKEYIMLRKKHDKCVFCASKEDLIPLHGKYYCRKCKAEFRKNGPDKRK